MNNSEKPISASVQWLVWGLLAMVILGIAVLFVQRRKSEISHFPVLANVPDFALTNQLGQKVTMQDLRGKVWVCDIIFTQCAGPCPRITELMSKIQTEIAELPNARLLTLTTDPEYDTPPVLKKYAERFKADASRWSFLTGTKKQIAELAGQGLKLTAVEKTPDQRTTDVDLFIHSTIFVIVDKHGGLRASFETDNPNAKAQIVEAVRELSKEK